MPGEPPRAAEQEGRRPLGRRTATGSPTEPCRPGPGRLRPWPPGAVVGSWSPTPAAGHSTPAACRCPARSSGSPSPALAWTLPEPGWTSWRCGCRWDASVCRAAGPRADPVDLYLVALNSDASVCRCAGPRAPGANRTRDTRFRESGALSPELRGRGREEPRRGSTDRPRYRPATPAVGARLTAAWGTSSNSGRRLALNASRPSQASSVE